MQDMLLKQDENGIFDLVIDGSDFASVDGFESAIVASYFTDSRASKTQVQEASKRRGWTGNILTVDIERELGGLLWILDQARNTQDRMNKGRSYAQNSLNWMIEDGIVKNIKVTVEKKDSRGIYIYTEIKYSDNIVKRYFTLWRNTNLNRII